MQIEKLEDLLTMDFAKLKSPDKTRLLTKIKQIVKADNKSEAGADDAAKDYPYEAVSVVGNKYVSIRFDLDTKDARVVDVEVDPRDAQTDRNVMGGANAIRKMQELVKKQKELNNEEN